jgi:hypothetical protein
MRLPAMFSSSNAPNNSESQKKTQENHQLGKKK